MPFRLSARARRDLERIHKYGLQEYGPDAADRYRLLLTVAMQDVAALPLLPGSRPLGHATQARCYPIRYSRLRVPSDDRVGEPVHQIVYRLGRDGTVEILAVVGSRYPAQRALRRRR